MNNFYVYVYLDPCKPGNYEYNGITFSHEPFYVGKGKNYRYKLHTYNNSKHVINKFLQNKINKIKRSIGSLPIIIKYKSNLKESESLLLETELIRIIGRRNEKTGPLVNLTNGGEGVSGKKHSEKTKKILSDKQKKRFEDPKEREKISIGLKNSEAYKLAISKAEYREKLRKSKLDPNGKFQKVMKSKKFSKKMSKAMSGENNHMFGKIGENNPRYGKGIKVYQYDLNNNLLKEWPNANIIEKETSFNRVTIERRCKKNSIKPYKNYIWSYNKT